MSLCNILIIRVDHCFFVMKDVITFGVSETNMKNIKKENATIFK